MEKQGGPSFQLRTALVSVRDADASQWNVHYVLHIEKKNKSSRDAHVSECHLI